jgi:quinol monooxygenase YgiN
MSTTFIATLTVKAGREREFERLQRELSEATHASEPGTLVYDVIKSRSKERTYVVYGRFKDDEAFQTHMASGFHDRLVPPILACVEGEMDLHMLDWQS